MLAGTLAAVGLDLFILLANDVRTGFVVVMAGFVGGTGLLWLADEVAIR
jgi:hypothetical protein